MTLVADGFSRRDHAELRRWGASLALVLLLHVGAGLYLASRRVPLDASGGLAPDAVMIDLAPAPGLPAPAPPVPPEPVTEPHPQPLVQQVPLPPKLNIPLPEVEPSPAPKPTVVLPKTQPKAKPRLKPVEKPPEAQPERSPPPAVAPAASAPSVAAAPAPPLSAPPAVNSGAERASWQAQLVAWLQRYKRYPRLAQEQRQEGVVTLRFTMDRTGHVLAAQIDKGSGFPLLDEEVSALIQRAQPLPGPPPDVVGAQITLTLPVQFSLRPGPR